MASRTGELAVPCPDGSTSVFSKRQIGCVIGRQVVPEFPYPRDQRFVAHGRERQVTKHGDSGTRPRIVQQFKPDLPPQRLKYLQVQHMWRYEFVILGLNSSSALDRLSHPHDEIEEDRCVEDDQRLSRS